ncbi:MAG: sulfatase-like hydrolase/transferase, partial [Myxococcota bacterium]|nr:sulfatase-like hydrolase/transferase [Myxococcota bacterium]
LAVSKKQAYINGSRITDLAIEALQDRSEEPLFLFLNYMDAHSPWHTREGYVDEKIQLDKTVLPRGKRWARTVLPILSGKRDAPTHIRRTWSEAYDAELRYLDEQVGRLLDALPKYGIDEQDLVILVSDHGEYLGEHRLVEHSKDLYSAAVDIPLLVRGPGFSAGRDSSPVQILDVPRWILDATGTPRLPDMVETTDLQVAELYWTRHRELAVKSLRDRFDRVRRSFVSGDRVLLLGSDGSREAFDRSTDPDEIEDQTGLVEDPWIDELEQSATTWLSGREPAEGVPVGPNPALEERLRALGYLE